MQKILNERVGHREAADRLAHAMHHDQIAGAAETAVQRVWIADVEGQMVAGVGPHVPRLDRIKAFGRLKVGIALLGAEAAGEITDRIGLDVREGAVSALFPDFEFRVSLNTRISIGARSLTPAAAIRPTVSATTGLRCFGSGAALMVLVGAACGRDSGSGFGASLVPPKNGAAATLANSHATKRRLRGLARPPPIQRNITHAPSLRRNIAS